MAEPARCQAVIAAPSDETGRTNPVASSDNSQTSPAAPGQGRSTYCRQEGEAKEADILQSLVHEERQQQPANYGHKQAQRDLTDCIHDDLPAEWVAEDPSKLSKPTKIWLRPRRA